MGRGGGGWGHYYSSDRKKGEEEGMKEPWKRDLSARFYLNLLITRNSVCWFLFKRNKNEAFKKNGSSKNFLLYFVSELDKKITAGRV